MINQLNSRSHAPTFQFGIQVPRSVKEANELETKNTNTNWSDAITSEINALNQYSTFQDKGIIPYLPGYKKIIVRFIFAVKHDLSYKALLVAGGHLTENPHDGSEYSGVVIVRSLAAAELN
jgi:hypothetical protein